METFAKVTIVGAVVLAVILSLVFALYLREPYLRGLDADLVSGVKQALEKSGDNSPQLKEALFECEGEKRRAMAYLISWMPASDLSTATSEYLVENIELSFEAWEESEWKNQVNEELFLSYVLPHRVSQEPLEAWRAHLHEELLPVVSGASSMTEAAILVNRWAGDMVTYKPTARRDQGPMETLKSGYGRCEELVILYVDALRSVGIPARQAWTPFWADRDDNHAWAEVYADGRWHYAGACEPRDSLNTAWFDDAVRGAALVYSKPYGIPSGERIESREGYYRINSTAIYADVCTLSVGLPAFKEYSKLSEVHVSVFNYGALRSIASEKPRRDGTVTFELGLGSYVISLQADGELIAEAVRLDRAGTHQMELVGDPVFDEGGSFWLRY